LALVLIRRITHNSHTVIKGGLMPSRWIWVGNIWQANMAEDEPSAESHHQLDDSGVEFIEGGAAPVSAV
jgi:hypothetical protein